MKNQKLDFSVGAAHARSAAMQTINTAKKNPVLLLAVAAFSATSALALNWPALVAIGLAPLILALAPCALMCAFGMCAMSPGGKSGSGGTGSKEDKP